MSMKLGREEELFLIGLGRKWLLESLGPNHGTDRNGHAPVAHVVKKRKYKRKPAPPKRKWTEQHRKNFLATIKKKWKQKRAEEKEAK